MRVGFPRDFRRRKDDGYFLVCRTCGVYGNISRNWIRRIVESGPKHCSRADIRREFSDVHSDHRRVRYGRVSRSRCRHVAVSGRGTVSELRRR